MNTNDRIRNLKWLIREHKEEISEGFARLQIKIENDMYPDHTVESIVENMLELTRRVIIYKITLENIELNLENS